MNLVSFLYPIPWAAVYTALLVVTLLNCLGVAISDKQWRSNDALAAIVLAVFAWGTFDAYLLGRYAQDVPRIEFARLIVVGMNGAAWSIAFCVFLGRGISCGSRFLRSTWKMARTQIAHSPKQLIASAKQNLNNRNYRYDPQMKSKIDVATA